MQFSSRVRVKIRAGIRFNVWLVSCYAHVFVRLQVVIVTLPTFQTKLPPQLRNAIHATLKEKKF